MSNNQWLQIMEWLRHSVICVPSLENVWTNKWCIQQQLNESSGPEIKSRVSFWNYLQQQFSVCQSLSSMSSSVLLFDVQRQGGRGHEPIAATAACHHSNAAPTVSMEAAATTTSSTSTVAGSCRSCWHSCGGGWLLELLLVDFAFFGPAVLEPDLHLEQKNSFCYLNLAESAQFKHLFIIFHFKRIILVSGRVLDQWVSTVRNYFISGVPPRHTP